ncbi:Gfo/Idh/MocA family protein [Salegentibacter chungangensis]|uniref:Gfo/Idh/MocA family protein n=1 Tax=Salegentibacter chungangensis TaxID=1335724 RepID=A0ABW3NTL9_9FLAO
MKVLIIGLGSIAKKHISALNEIGNFDIHAYRSSHDSQNYNGVKNVYEEKGFDKYDFFLISNPTSKHLGTIKSLLKYKKPLFIEKPLFSDTGAEYQKIVQEIEESDIPSYIGCNLRFLKSLQKMKELFSSLIVNEINIYCGSYLPDWRPGTDYRKVYSANRKQGGGVNKDLIHELDYLYWIAGEPVNSRAVFKSNSSLSIDAIDYANYIWEYDGFCANIILNYYRRDPKRTFEIVAQEGTYLVDLLANRITKNGEVIFASDYDIGETYFDQMKYFTDEILIKGESSTNNSLTAYKILELCLKN